MRTKHFIAMASVVVFGVGCAPDDEALPNDPEEVLASTSSALRINPVDPVVPAGPASINMLSGHQARLLTSRFYSTSITVGGLGSTTTHTFRARTLNCSGDTGMVVRARTAFMRPPAPWRGTAYNDDAPQGQGGSGGTSPHKSSAITLTNSGPVTYDIFVFSQDRATAYCSLWTQVDNGAWTFVTADHFGGALVELGPLSADAFVEANTPQNGAGADDTEMMIFDIGSKGSVTAGTQFSGLNNVLQNDNQSTSDLDPRITVSSSATPSNWGEVRTFALVGKKVRTLGSTSGIETWVDLRRGPLNQGLTTLAFPTSNTLPRNATSASVTLSPGRYVMWLTAQTSNPVGSMASGANPMNAVECTHQLPLYPDVAGSPRYPEEIFDRGRLNGPAFEMAVYRLSADVGVAQTLDNGRTVRRVARGAFGAENLAHRFAVAFEVKSAGTYVLQATGAPNDISFGTSAYVVRNPDSTELKVAMWNLLYDDLGVSNDGSVPEYRNASNLLSTRGSIHASTGQIEERKDQAPYQWQADVVALTENRTLDFLEAFENEAESARGGLNWQFLHGQNEGNSLGVVWGRGALFASENLWPTSGDISLPAAAFTATSDCSSPPLTYHCSKSGGAWVKHPRCTSGCYTDASSAVVCQFDDPRYQHCYIKDANDESPARDKWIIPGRVRVHRWGQTADRHIMVAALHLHSDAGKGQDDRRAEARSIADRVQDLLTAGCADCTATGAPVSLFDGNNRIILVGDFNVFSHGCGEHYWILRALRERFGYAVDAAVAAEDSDTLSLGMHDWGTRLDSASGFPLKYLGREVWEAMTGASKWLHPGDAGFATATSAFPWWSRTYRGTTACPGYGGDRHDLVILVGRGWASDDPVRGYTVMQDSNKENPLAVRDESGVVLGGVEMFDWNSTACEPGYGRGGVPDSGNNYNPNHDLGIGTGVGPGRPAVHTDHRPIAARLRILTLGEAGDR